MVTRMQTLLSFENEEQAEVLREKLENAGIMAEVALSEVADELPGTSDAPVPGYGGRVLLRVAEADAKRAAEVLEEEADDMMGDNPSVM